MLCYTHVGRLVHYVESWAQLCLRLRLVGDTCLTRKVLCLRLRLVGDTFLTRKVPSKRILTEKEEWLRPTIAGYVAWNFGSEFTTWHRINLSRCEVSTRFRTGTDFYGWTVEPKAYCIQKIERTFVNWIQLVQDLFLWQTFLNTLINHRAGMHKFRPPGHRGD